MKVLGIDFGTKRIGLALSDAEGIVAERLPVLSYRNEENAVMHIFALVRTRHIDTILMGHPLDIRGRQTRVSRLTNRFVRLIREKLPDVTVLYWDEAMTSMQARVNRKHTGEKFIDSEAARIMLQEYLEHQVSERSD